MPSWAVTNDLPDIVEHNRALRELQNGARLFSMCLLGARLMTRPPKVTGKLRVHLNLQDLCKRVSWFSSARC